MSNLKAQLEKIKDNKNENLYNHLCNIFSKVLLDCPKNAFDVFEDYSHQIKQQQYNFKKHDDFVDNSRRMREKYEEVSKYCLSQKKQLDKLNDGAEEPQDVASVGFVPNLLEQARWFEWGGVGFGTEETYRIFKSLTTLSFKKQAKMVRLWGKILCSKKDYYVAEAQTDGGEDAGELAPNVEPKGQKGVNRLSYFVTNDLLGDWTELPIVTPEQIQTSRRLKYIFTGNLDQPVISNPHFNGLEKHLLKCQIVRIYYSTTLYPATLYQVTQDDPREIEPKPEEENKKFPEFDFLCSQDNWVHYTENILNEARLIHMPPVVTDQDQDEEKLKKEQQEKDPFEARLKPIANDKPPQGQKQAWTLKRYGDITDYRTYTKDQTKLNSGVIVIKSLHWPGSVTVYQWQSLYVGYGFKQSNELFYPKEPEMVLEEQPDTVEQPEPNFPPEENKPKGGEAPDKDNENPDGN